MKVTPVVRHALAVALLASCAAAPPPDWQVNAHEALQAALAAYLRGETRAAEAQFARARREVTRSGRADLLARVELARCAAQVASLVFDPCTGYDALREDAPPAEQAYAAYLEGRAGPQHVPLLPPAQQAVARGAAPTAALAAIEDPLARLIAAGVLLRSERLPPEAVPLAVQAASREGWRRPLAAWLGVQAALAQRAGDAEEAARLRRQIDRVLGGGR
ncbi:MAG: hypothetical protein NZL99_07725 [Burkholderiaceae bacterium]|nr:hypothetical protein [Burkholderiaceae bacterium]MCX7901942.1 hypothetical protein [Burkholderiaceae bacterium]